MTITEMLAVLKRMDQLIQTRSTGSPEDFAGRLYISTRSLYNYIKLLKSIGAPVYYCRISRSYVYTTDGQLVLEFEHAGKSAHVK